MPALLLTLLLGCRADLPAPTVLAVDPPRGWNGEPTVVEIAGSGFYPQVVFDASRADEADLDTDFSAWLVDDAGERHDLGAVDVESFDQVQAVVPAGLAPGLYDLQIRGPTGRSDTLPDAFEVSDQHADRLALVSDSVVFGVDDLALVRLELLGPDGERVLEDLGVELSIAGDEGPVPVQWNALVLEGQVVGSDGQSIHGLLTDGSALVGLQVPVAGTVELSVTSTDDAGVSGDEIRLEFEPSDVLQVVIHLPSPDFVAQAGVPFEVTADLLDEFGNLVLDRTREVTFQDACESWVSSPQVLRGSTTFTVDAITRATDPTGVCASDWITAEDLGQSAPFAVEAGDADRFRVLAENRVRAGDPLTLFATALDAYDNRTEWTGDVTWALGAGPSQPATCTDIDPGLFTCNVTPTVAGPGQTILLTGDDGTSGVSNPVTVLSDDVATKLTAAAPGLATAGVPFLVDLALYDVYGNQVDGALFDPASFGVTSSLGPVDCVLSSVDLAGGVHLSCTMYAAGGYSLSAYGPDGVAASFPLSVTNGALAAVALVAPAQIEAGVGAVVLGQGADAWGNPYLVQPDPVLDLTDDLGTWSATRVTFAADGGFVVSGTLTAAGTTHLVASQGGVVVGTSAAVEVLAGPAGSFAVEPLEPWAWAGIPSPVEVTALDAWGNRATWSGDVALASRAGVAAGSVALAGGYGVADLVWSAPVLLDAVVADAAGMEGESRDLYVVADCDVDPVLALTFLGSSVPRACVDPVAGGSFRGSFAASLAQGPALAGYALAIGAEVVDSASAAVTLPTPGIGAFELRGLVVRSDGCGAEVATTAWAGPDDGEPVGPIAVAPDLDAIDVLTGATDIHLDGVLDCTGAPAAGGIVRVRADRGSVLGATPTGAGLAVTLDATGSGVVTLDASAADMGGPATVLAWAPSGAAGGAAAVDLVGDARAPTVWFQSPIGQDTGTIPEIRVTFSEAVQLPGPAAVDLAGPLGPVSAALALDGPDTLVITPSAPLDGAQGIFTLTLSTDVRDLAGNRLDGASIGSASAWYAELGAVGGPVDPVGCTPLQTVFRPDGDDGAGIEADEAAILVSSATTPDAWRVEVAPAADPTQPLRVDRGPAVSPDDLVPWDGRDATGRVVANGDYLLTITPLDAAGDPGGSCTQLVTVANDAVTL